MEQLLFETGRQEKLQHRHHETAYLQDLRTVLRLTNGSGLRVLRHWLDAAGAENRLNQAAPQVHAAAALMDYSRDRMAEMALADPLSHVRMQLVASLRWAKTELSPERQNHTSV